MSELSRCPKCGARLPDDAPAGICPKCLVRAGFESEGHAEPQAGATPTSPGPSRFEPPSAEELSSQFPQLDVQELLGTGGMGAVYKARQPGLDRLVAVKILPPEVGNDPLFAERFTREARAMARLSHPHIVAVYDFGQTDGIYYLVMEFVDGANLRQTIQSGNLRPEEALALVPQICDALQYAHDEGIVHRDIKPENILLDKKGRLKIADFGLSKLLSADRPEVSLTGTHQVMGTLRYMAPEQMEGSRDIDHRADIYSLGVVFYEMLTGELPLGRFDLPSQKIEVDVRLDEVVLRALEREPNRRYQHASEVKTDVESITSRMRPSPGPEQPSLSVGDQFLVDSAFEQVHGPSVGLFATGIAYWVTIPMAFLLWELGAFNEEVLGRGLWWFFFLQPVLAGAVLMFSGVKMKRLESYPVAVAAAVLPLVILVTEVVHFLLTRRFGFGPGDLVGPPMGLWALVVLTRLEVRAAFARLTFQKETEPRSLHPGDVKSDTKSISDSSNQLTSVNGIHALLPPQLGSGLAPRQLLLAISFVVCVLSVAAGVTLLVIVVMNPSTTSGWLWGGLGGAFGCILGGGGGLVGLWIQYRRKQGTGDLMRQPGWTWLDSLTSGLAAVGMAALGAVLIFWQSISSPARFLTLSIGGIAVVEAGSYLLLRVASKRALRQTAKATGFDPRLVLVAIHMVLGALAVAAGVVLLAIGVMSHHSAPDRLWGWVGGALGCMGGGAGALVGSWNSYRRIEGASDLMEQPGWSWLDWGISAWGLFGLLGLAAGLVLSLSVSRETSYTIILLGGIFTFQGALFLVIRGLLRRAARQEAAAESEPRSPQHR